MSVVTLDPAAMLDQALEYAARNIKIETLLIRLGLDPSNVTYDAIIDRLLDLALASLTASNILALIAGIFLALAFVVRTIVLMRVLTIVSIVLFLASAALSGSIPSFFMYLLALPINVIRLVQIRNLVKRAQMSAQVSVNWLKPFMTPRNYLKGDVLFRKGDAATEMLLTVTGKFLVTEIAIELPPGRILGELGFLTPKNRRTQTVECIEDGEVLTITYDKLLEIDFQNAEFGYHLLRLTSDRLLQNIARLEGVRDQYQAKLLTLTAAKTASNGASKPLPVAPPSRFAGDRAMTKQQLTLAKRQDEIRPDSRMFARPRKFLKKRPGNRPLLDWLGSCGTCDRLGDNFVDHIWQSACISGSWRRWHDFWLIGIRLRYILARP